MTIADEKKDEPKPTREAGDDEARGGSRREEGREAGRQEDDGAGAAAASRHRLRRPRRARRARAGRRPTTTRGLAATKDRPALHRQAAPLLRPRQRPRRARCASSRSRTARRRAGARTSAAMRSRPTARSSWSRAGSAVFSDYVDATPKGAGSKKTVSTAGLHGRPRAGEEWAQIFDEVWRRYRDFFYVAEHARLRLGGAAQAVRAAARSTSRTAPT